MATAADKKRWDKLHDDLDAADAAQDEVESALRLKYGGDALRPSNRHWMSRTERTRLEKAEAKVDKIRGQIYELVQRISPRDWGRGVPGHWVTHDLTWEDAIRPADEPLSVVVPGSYGYPDGYVKEETPGTRRSLSLWKYNRITGLWDHVRTVTSETRDEWLRVFQRDEPGETFVVSKNKPSRAPTMKETPMAHEDDREIPIANPGDYSDDSGLFQFQFGAYADTKVYVWSDSFDNAEEIAIEWADDNARGVFVTLTEDDLKEAAEDLGIEWDEAWSDGGAVGRREFGQTWTPFDDREYEKIVQQAEADLIVVGWTTLKSGTHVISHEVHAHEVTDADEIEEVADRSVEEEEEEERESDLEESADDEEDEEENDEIRSNIEAEVQKMVDESAAQDWSQLGDQLMMDLEEMGYDDQSAYVIAAFGNEPMIAVNEDTTFSREFAREIGVKPTEDNVYIWSETGTRELESWLSKNGYEVVNRLGGDVPSTEAFAVARFVIEAVAREMDLDEDVVKKAAEGIDWWPKDRGRGDQEIAGSSDGDTTVWAKPLEQEDEEDEDTEEDEEGDE